MSDEAEDKPQSMGDAFRAWGKEPDEQSMQRRGASDAERAWYAAAIEFMDKYEGKTEVDLTERLNKWLSLVFIRHPDRHLSNEDGPVKICFRSIGPMTPPKTAAGISFSYRI